MTNERPVRLVVAEDDFLVCEEIKRILRGSRYTVIGEAGNGREAVQLVADLHPDAVLMDIRMPEMDGLDASRRITEEHPTPIVIMTAYESADLVEKAGSNGVGAFLTKPPLATEIDRALTIAMARHNDLMELRRLNQELQNAMAEIKTLRGILPICSYCKKIRTQEGVWEDVAIHIQRHTEASPSHGLCPECLQRHYPEAYAAIQQKK
ncbi:MAG: ANTAR domain-containing response regulator [Thermodesulfobacteriota bacterium]